MTFTQSKKNQVLTTFYSKKILSKRNIYKSFFNTPNFRFILLIVVAVFFVAGCNNTSSNKSLELTNEDRTMIDTIVARKFRSVPVPGLAVGLVIGDQTYTQTMGYSDISLNTPFTDSTIFCTGILSETFTSSLALVLEKQFGVNLNDPIYTYLPHFSLNSKTYKNITIKHLLTQTSGVPRHGLMWDYPNMSDSALYLTTWSIRLQEPEFETPGTRVVRSPYNFDIAADLIANASKMRFEKFAARYMFEPLQMKHSTYDPEIIFKNNYAKPHVVSNWLTYKYEPSADYPINGEHAGSIGWHTSIEDATSWMSLLINGGKFRGEKIISSEMAEQLMNPVFTTDKETGAAIGLGWEIIKKDDVHIFIKAGEIGAFDNALVIIPEYKMGVIVATNSQSDFQPAIFAQELLFSVKDKIIPKYLPSIHLEMGRILDSNKSVDEAISFFNKVNQNKQDDYYCSDLALSQLGSNLLYRLGWETDAFKVFEACLNAYPNSIYAHLNIAEYYLFRKDIEKTENKLVDIEKMTNNEPDVLSRIKMIKGTLELLKEKQAEKAQSPVEEKKDSICIPCEDETNLN